jgi:hypothetical protein
MMGVERGPSRVATGPARRSVGVIVLQDHQAVRCHAGELITLSVSCIGLVIGLAQVLGAVEISFSHFLSQSSLC